MEGLGLFWKRRGFELMSNGINLGKVTWFLGVFFGVFLASPLLPIKCSSALIYAMQAL